jgi:NitT/TauT family transport system substrate-binding protein
MARYRPKFLTAHIIASLTLALAAAGNALAADKVVVGHGSTQIEITHPGLYLGGVLGYSAKEGLDLDVQLSQGSQQAIQLLAAGRVDFVAVTAPTILAAREQGVNARIVYSEVAHDNNAMATLSDGKFQTIASLKGTDIGVFSMQSGSVPFLKALLAESGLKPEDVNMVPLGAGAAALDALKTGKASALVLWAGAFAVFENQGANLKVFQSRQLDTAPGFILATTDDYIKKNPAIVAKMGRIYAMSHVFAMTNPEGTVHAYWKAVPASKPAEITPKVIAENKHILEVGLRDMRVDNRTDKRFGWNNPDGIDALQSYLISNGARSVKIPVNDTYTNDLVDAYNNFDMAAVKKQASDYKP